MYHEGGWLTQRTTERLLQIVRELDKKCGRNENGRGHWDEIEFIRKILSTGDDVADFSKDNLKLHVLKFRHDNSSKEISNYPTYVLKHSVDNKNCCKIEKLFSCGVFSSDRPCVLLLRNDHFYNVWGHDSLFDDVDNPRIGSKENVGALQDTRNCFVYVVWFPMLMIICIFAKAGVIVVWGLLKIMRLMILKNFL